MEQNQQRARLNTYFESKAKSIINMNHINIPVYMDAYFIQDIYVLATIPYCMCLNQPIFKNRVRYMSDSFRDTWSCKLFYVIQLRKEIYRPDRGESKRKRERDELYVVY
jgi:hypothetical protein